MTSNRNIPRTNRRTSSLPQDGLAFALRESGALVQAVIGGKSLTDLFDQRARAQSWSDKTRAAIRDMVWGCLRDHCRGEVVLAQFIGKPLPLTVHALLLVAVHRLRARPDQSHTVVDQTVEAVATLNPRLSGVANAVLRNILREPDKVEARIVAHPAARFAHPEWWVARLRRDHPNQWEAIVAAGNQKPPMSVRVNRGRTDPERMVEALEHAGIHCRAHANGALQLERPMAVSALPGFADGLLSVQDAGAQWAAHWLGANAGERVLDACSAPGGKAAHLLERSDIALTALELEPGRIGRIHDNLNRLGLSARVVQGDAAKPDEWWDGKPFDRILADVPCSASGVVRRHPDIKWLRRPEDVVAFSRQQQRIIDALWRILAPGGTMLYATCSVFAEENRNQVDRFCGRHADARLLPLNDQPDFALLPNEEHDGFYYALLAKRA